MLQTKLTSPDQFEHFLKLLPQIPLLIPIIANSKKPDIPIGESWKNPKYHLTPEQAIIRLCEGKNVGVVANDWLVIVDLDNPTKFKLEKKNFNSRNTQRQITHVLQKRRRHRKCRRKK